MCKLGSPSTPAAPPPPEPIKEAPKMADAAVAQAYNDEKAAARRAGGRSGTILTGFDLATTSANTAQKTLLG